MKLQPLIEVKNLKKYFEINNGIGKKKNVVKAIDDVSFTIFKGETYGLVGESGCGKSTTGRTLLKLIEATSGECIYNGKNILQMKNREMAEVRRDFQMVFQDPYSSLNPKKRIGQILEESLIIHKIGDKNSRTEMTLEILKKVGFQEEHYFRYPHEFSGGQRQRIGLARALILNPQLIICDEPVSALDVSIQSQVINLLQEVQKSFDLTYLFIAHDLSVVRHISDRIGVMYLGNIVEEAQTDELFERPLHPYTQALISAVPISHPKQAREKIKLKGEIPSPLNPPSGCVFHTRCPYATEICQSQKPDMRTFSSGRRVACHLVEE
ncbi:ABC transporter ATP-binding protein [Ureibacillus manganicus]|uniref:Peptide ABC transporter ATP-binding protein n=1 Tax=Ureibacillus manganicus DSM 26584 TaxID=1384049 RepID=A0A0A3HZP4_9BACL|nr:dipeptide ABC transporter ATP-binding protein [Ureibacillus manganicus]KGR78071.1 peptide ABC transporter ATP-binding protein [Ureibacillus manganicus DSM 26584]